MVHFLLILSFASLRELLIWILSSELQEVRVSTSSKTTIHVWTDTVEILDGVTFCLNDMDLSHPSKNPSLFPIFASKASCKSAESNMAAFQVAM
jgi:hypothetical protein